MRVRGFIMVLVPALSLGAGISFLQGSDSVVLHGYIERVASDTDDFGAGEIIVDSIDVHVPIGTLCEEVVHY